MANRSILLDFGTNILEEETDNVIFQTDEFPTDVIFIGSQGLFWWLPLLTLQSTVLTIANQLLVNSCLMV